MKFAYKAKDADGNLVDGTREVVSKFVLNKDLEKEGLKLLSAKEKRGIGIFDKLSTIGTVKTMEKINFGKNISTMLKAGLPISRSITIVERQTRNKVFKKVLSGILEQIKKGQELSDALKKYPRVFPPLFVSMVAAGEESGNLAGALKLVSDQVEKSYTLKKKIKGAMIYPGVIMSVMVLVGVFMLFFIVPTLTKTFKELELDLPSSTKFIIAFSDFTRNNFAVTLAIIFAVSIFFYWIGKTKGGRRAIEWTLLHLPLIGNLVKQVNAARTARTLSSLLGAGVPYLDSLKITKDVIQNSYYKDVISKAEESVQVGVPVSDVFKEADKIYPIFMGEMISVGEETGQLKEMLLNVAEYFEKEVDEKTKNMSTIIEPFLMVFVGIGVGFFAVSMISPMYQLVESI